MANVKIIVNGPLVDGHRVTFKAPCTCKQIEYLDVRYISGNTQESRLFTMKDSHGNDITGIGNLFEEGAYVHAILDTQKKFAYLQNADTNGYLERRLNYSTYSVSGVTEAYNSKQILKYENEYVVPTKFENAMFLILLTSPNYPNATGMYIVTLDSASMETGGGHIATIVTTPVDPELIAYPVLGFSPSGYLYVKWDSELEGDIRASMFKLA